MSMLLFLGSLSWISTPKSLFKTLSRFGQVNYVELIVERMTGRSRGFGYAEMDNPESAIEASRKGEVMDGGRNFTVQYARLTDESIFGNRKPRPGEKYTWDDSIREAPIIQISQEINLSFIEHLIKKPTDMYNLTSRKFEELIAELISGSLGYDVELTPQTRDGGKDIIVRNKGGFNLTFYVECKRYKEDHLVSVDVVRKLHSVVVSDKINKGIIATTSYFTRDALVLINNSGNLLEPKDRDGIINWMNIYTSKSSKA